MAGPAFVRLVPDWCHGRRTRVLARFSPCYYPRPCRYAPGSRPSGTAAGPYSHRVVHGDAGFHHCEYRAAVDRAGARPVHPGRAVGRDRLRDRVRGPADPGRPGRRPPRPPPHVPSRAAGLLARVAVLLIASRIVQGAGAALVAPAALSLITTSFPAGPQRARAVGLYGSMAAVGFVSGQLLGGILVE